MAINVLTARKVETAVPKDKPYSLKDGGSLFLLVQPNGSKLWRFRYRIVGTPNIYAIGKFPVVSLEQARAKRNEARALVKQGIHPALDRKAGVAAQVRANEETFEAMARLWMDSNKGWSADYRNQVENNLDNRLFPKIGMLPIRDVKATHLKPLIETTAKEGAETVAILLRQWSSQIFAYATGQGVQAIDPTPSLRRLIKRPPVRHNPPLSWAELHEFLTKLDGWAGYRTTVLALELMARTFVRTVELRKGRWADFDLDNALWTIPAAHMKMRQIHLVPLSRQAVAALRELHTLTGGGAVLFPNYRRPTQIMSATTLNRALDRLGFRGRFSAHGFRSTATTQLGMLGYDYKRAQEPRLQCQPASIPRSPFRCRPRLLR